MKEGSRVSAVPVFLVFILSAWFCVLVFSQYIRNHRLSHLFWSLSLAFSALASLCYCLAIWTNPHSFIWFTGYYMLGAMWMPSLMGLGSIALTGHPRAAKACAMGVGAVGLTGSVLLLHARVSTPALQALNGGAGTGIIESGRWLLPLIVLNTFGAAAVVFVAVWSAWKTGHGAAPSRFFHGNLWLAIGIVVISAAGSAARLGWPQLFWVVMLIGWILTFVGYRLLTPRSSA